MIGLLFGYWPLKIMDWCGLTTKEGHTVSVDSTLSTCNIEEIYTNSSFHHVCTRLTHILHYLEEGG